jgi:hypothetical protein
MLRVPYPEQRSDLADILPDALAAAVAGTPTPAEIGVQNYMADAKALASFGKFLPKGVNARRRPWEAGKCMVGLNGSVKLATTETIQELGKQEGPFPKFDTVRPKESAIVGETPWFNPELLGDLLVKIGEVLAGRHGDRHMVARIRFTGPDTPAVIECAHDPNLIAVVMPVTIRK